MTTAYLQDFERSLAVAPRAGWLEELRRLGREHFGRTGIPTSRDEDWRFNNLAPLAGADFRLAPADAAVRVEEIRPFLAPLPNASTLVFVNGRYVPGLSSICDRDTGVTVSSLNAAFATHGDLVRRHLAQYDLPARGGFSSLNTAFIHDGLFVHVAAGADAGAPIHAVFVTSARGEGAATHLRNLILIDAGARASVIESYIGLTGGSYLTTAVTEAVVAPGAFLEHTKIQRESEQAYHIGTTHLHQDRESRSESFSVSFGAALCRNNLDMVLDGPDVNSQLFGMYMGRGRQELDNHTSILHAHPNCGTREVYKGILDDRSHGIFNGKIYVTPEAQKTDAKQTNRALLLSDTARIDTKPQLEIFADDVKCTHGATVGSLDPLALFYLKSRGVGAAQARKILTYAFAAEVLEEIPHEPIRRQLESLVMSRLENLGQG
ncbi:MAG TPA: Fe-S cluster assembly protein SufD [Gemmatimonadales bacterium]|nr:Fe-S cluster assembly protein SufD [Gemmatimonadales bacterium]